MYKFFRRLAVCGLIAAVIWCAYLLQERKNLTDSLIRFHVVANSDSDSDQAVKLKVRDAVLASIQRDLASVADISAARAYLSENTQKIQMVVNATLRENGYPEHSSVRLCKERFDTRHYDTFSLPAGIYESLRIIIGEGNGRNWWCVTFPSLCDPATSAEFEDTAVSSGFHKSMVKTLSGQKQYTVRFYLLDKLGELENIFWSG